ncbi:MAG: hypothetical protein IKB34_00400 [Clostridia bacterium]|nr:hypothetical protein [Clostridia bacterium]
MEETKLLKAYCRKTGKKFILQMHKKGSTWKTVNFVDLNEDEYGAIYSEIRVDSPTTADSLVPCEGCGKRNIGGCSCPQRICDCRSGTPYNFQCIYCNELKIEYSRRITGGPYTKWAGISQIPEATKDRFGNPEGGEYDLADDGSFQGYKILIYNMSDFSTIGGSVRALEKKGFTVDVFTGNFPETPEALKQRLADKSQFWFLSWRDKMLSDQHVRVITDFFNQGHGIYIMGDNIPFVKDANAIIQPLFGASLDGNYIGKQVLSVQSADGAPGIIPNHLIATGIENFYEGVTISNISGFRTLKPLIYSSDRKVVTAYYDDDGKRALVDGGFTRLNDTLIGSTAGTLRYIVNAAAWLANTERFGYEQ